MVVLTDINEEPGGERHQKRFKGKPPSIPSLSSILPAAMIHSPPWKLLKLPLIGIWGGGALHVV